uniref:Uncharacterized protein n=1 Tax=Lepeophtheirus salmonis TaxID=72036 RepID=A0A0K2U8C9_LEPSM
MLCTQKNSRGGCHQGCRGRKSAKKEFKRLIQNIIVTEEIGFFHCWCQKWRLHPHKALSTHFFDSSLDSLV